MLIAVRNYTRTGGNSILYSAFLCFGQRCNASCLVHIRLYQRETHTRAMYQPVHITAGDTSLSYQVVGSKLYLYLLIVLVLTWYSFVSYFFHVCASCFLSFFPVLFSVSIFSPGQQATQQQQQTIVFALTFCTAHTAQEILFRTWLFFVQNGNFERPSSSVVKSSGVVV